MVPYSLTDRTDRRMDGWNGQTDRCMDDAKTISLRLRGGIKNSLQQAHDAIECPFNVDATIYVHATFF